MKKYILRFLGGILLFIGLNFYSLAANHKGCIDCYGDFGIPFTLALVHSGHSHIGFYEFIWTGVIADLIFAMLCSFAIGFIWSKIRSKTIG